MAGRRGLTPAEMLCTHCTECAWCSMGAMRCGSVVMILALDNNCSWSWESCRSVVCWSGVMWSPGMCCGIALRKSGVMS